MGYVDIGPGTDDRGAVGPGRWRDLGAGQIDIGFPESHRTPSVRQIPFHENAVLKITK
jgi:hypothetical protein